MPRIGNGSIPRPLTGHLTPESMVQRKRYQTSVKQDGGTAPVRGSGPPDSNRGTSMTPDEYCRLKAAPTGSTFHYAFLFVTPLRRRALTALQAYCRELDDAADLPTDPAVAQAKIAWWRTETARLLAGMPQHPVTREFQAVLDPFDIGREELAGIIDGRQRRLDVQRLPDFETLESYCRSIADEIGRLSARVCGFRDPRTVAAAGNLWGTCQLIQTIRDLGDDVRRNRILLPTDELKRFNVPAADILNRSDGAHFRELMEFQAGRADRHCADALAGLPPVDRRSQHPALIMAEIHRGELDEIRRDGFQVLRHRTTLTPLRKLWIACRTRAVG